MPPGVDRGMKGIRNRRDFFDSAMQVRTSADCSVGCSGLGQVVQHCQALVGDSEVQAVFNRAEQASCTAFEVHLVQHPPLVPLVLLRMVPCRCGKRLHMTKTRM